MFNKLKQHKLRQLKLKLQRLQLQLNNNKLNIMNNSKDNVKQKLSNACSKKLIKDYKNSVKNFPVYKNIIPISETIPH